MSDSLTDFLSLTKPEVGASPDTWGDKLNADLDALDAAIKPMVEAHNYADASGADVIVLTLDPAPSAYVDGLRVRFKAAADNTTGPTLNVNGLGAKAVKFADGAKPAAGELVAEAIYVADYDGSAFVLDRLPPATATEVQGATSTRPVTPAGAAVTAGEWALGGFYVKWGTVSVTSSASAGGTAVTFATPFPTACDIVQVSKEASGGSVPDVITSAWYSSKSTTGFTAGVDRDFGADSAFTVSWLAIGR